MERRAFSLEAGKKGNGLERLEEKLQTNKEGNLLTVEEVTSKLVGKTTVTAPRKKGKNKKKQVSWPDRNGGPGGRGKGEYVRKRSGKKKARHIAKFSICGVKSCRTRGNQNKVCKKRGVGGAKGGQSPRGKEQGGTKVLKESSPGHSGRLCWKKLRLDWGTWTKTLTTEK